MTSLKIKSLLAGSALVMLSACSIAKNYTEAEQEIVADMTPTKYQPATRQNRQAIETQDLLAQAAFWSREYQLNPADLEAAVKLAAAVRKMGNPAKAAEITQMTRAMYPDDVYLIAEHSAALIALEKGRETIKPLDNALRTAPGYARLWSLKGAALDQIGQYDQARQHYNRALQINPQDPNVMANMGLSFALAGDPATAERWLRQAAAHPDASAGIRQNLDLVLKIQGKAPASTPQANLSKPAPTQRQIQGQTQYQTQGQSQAARQPARTVQQPMQIQAYGTYQRPAQNTNLGHRSNMTVVGGQPGAPKSSAEMARAIAQKSGSQRVTVPYQPQTQHPTQPQTQLPQQVTQARPQARPTQPSGDILPLISQSLNQKQSAAVQSRQMQQQQAMGVYAPRQHAQPPAQYAQQGAQQSAPYPQQYSRPVPQQQYTQNGYPAVPQNYEDAPERRGSLRRR